MDNIILKIKTIMYTDEYLNSKEITELILVLIWCSTPTKRNIMIEIRPLTLS